MGRQFASSELTPEERLALAVVQRAFRDLRVPLSPPPGLWEDSDNYRATAASLLLLELWEPDNLWGNLLKGLIDHDDIVPKAQRLLDANPL
ncbi:hypothetical protein [uncultured Mediterranean phage uvDeep-CGR2-AD3-C191]|nr:hypothetical protein [uncultured Mediterranean phage uvDeep-CGR2-AD3-C191]